MSKKKIVLNSSDADSLSLNSLEPEQNTMSSLSSDTPHKNPKSDTAQNESEMFSQLANVAVANISNDTQSVKPTKPKTRELMQSKIEKTSKSKSKKQTDLYSDLDEDTLQFLRSAHDVANDTYDFEFTQKESQLDFKPKISNEFPLFSTIASLLWVIGTGFWAFAYPYTSGVAYEQLFTLNRFVIFTIASALPISLFITAAVFIRRANEMSSASQALAQSALRLMDPETLAHGTIESVAGAVRREISTLSDGVERALLRASELESLVQSEVSSIELSYSENEVRLRGLIDSLVEQRGVITLEGDKLKLLIKESETSLSEKLLAASAQMVQMVESASVRASASLEAKGIEISDNLLDVSSKVLGALAERSDEMTKTLVDAEKSIVSNMQSVGDTLAATVTDRLSSITFDLDTRTQNFVETMSNYETKLELTFEKTGTAILDGIVERSTDANAALKLTSDTLLTDLMIRSAELNSKWDELGSNITAKLHTQAIESIDKIAIEQEKLTNHLNTAIASIEAKISSSENQLTNAIVAQADTVSIALEEQKKSSAEALGKIAVDVSTLINNQITELQNTIDIRIEGMLSHLNIEGDHIAAALDERLKLLAKTLADGSEELNSGRDSMNSAIEKLQNLTAENMANSTIQLADILKTTVMETSDELLQKTSDTLELISSKTEAVVNAFQNMNTNAIAKVEDKLEGFEARILENTRIHSANWDERLIGFDENVTAKLQEIFAQFDNKISKVDEAMSNRTQHLNEVFLSSTTALAQTLSEGTVSVLSSIDNKSTAVAKTFENQIEAIESILNSYKSSTTDKFNEHIALLTQNLEQHTDTLENQLNSHKSMHDISIQSHAEVIKISLSETLEALENHVNKDALLITTTMSLHTEKMIADIQEQTARAADALSARTQELEALVASRTEALNTLVNDNLPSINDNFYKHICHLKSIIDDNGNSFLDRLNIDGDALAQRIQTSANNAMELLNHTNTMFNETITSGLGDLGKTIIETHDAIKDTLATKGQDSVHALRETQVALSISLSDAVDKLNAQNEQLSLLVNNAKTQLTAIGADLSTHMNNFQSVTTGATLVTEDSLNKLSQQVSLLHRSTNTAIKEAQDLSKEFAAQTQNMALTMQNMEESAKSVKASMLERRESLTQLAHLMVGAAAEIDHKIGGATARIDDSLSLTAEHVERLTNSISSVAENTSRDILAQFERMTLVAGDQSMRTTEAVKRAYDDVSEEMSRGMRLATNEFTQASAGLKNLVSDVQNEIKETSEILYSSLKNLPTQTQQNTAELRRVVADQLRALNDLSEMIARQSTRMDISRPSISQPLAIQPVASEMRQTNAEISSQIQVSTKPSWFTQTPSNRTNNEPTSKNTNATKFSRSHFTKENEDAKTQVADNFNSSIQTSQVTEQQTANWLKDLLNKADEHVSEQNIESEKEYSTFGADLAKAVDTDSLVEAWENYRKGDNSAFTRRIYTLSGQNTFDEVNRRYHRDSDFRKSVDRYCQDFERLLTTVANKDKNGSIVLSYIESDTGKVYTLLSHAAGRL